ncbi:TRAP-type C4-dicarboxylate transport system, small permease component [Palleronia marisminoris]|uniref:TRAP transporter small permease protein n=1 Tax=Palleronia marisminoris TaxID=315423 RepID=A0A1Y5RMB7_9RHOB|nr:TRAP-type C4-dicarboxylate transport system, small permease component [Palleronia marisminoris]SLN20818.1 Sialic acid TRAP transporter permease protein SiaT [Palleronia marisminoris]
MTSPPDPAHDGTQTTTTDASDTLDDVSALPGLLGTIDLAVARIEAVLLAAGVLLMAANTVANVVGRYVFGSSIFFSEELNRILIILITFAGISYAARHGRHIRMSAIYDALPPKGRKVMMILIAGVTAICMFGLAWYSFGFIRTSAGQGRLLPSLQIPVWWTLVWVPLGFTLTGIQYALTAFKNIVEDDIYLSTNVLEGYGTDEEREV